MSKKQKWYTNLYNLLSDLVFLTTLYKTTFLKHIKMLKQNQIKQKKNPTLSKFQASIFLFFLCNLSFSFCLIFLFHLQKVSPCITKQGVQMLLQSPGHGPVKD